jgi:ubiquinone/menaquinone biosynthesis C-methylase UbiE
VVNRVDVGVQAKPADNIDPKTVQDFGEDWAAFDQTAMSRDELGERFDEYFAIFPFETLPVGAEGFDLGCGSGRWAEGVAARVGKLHCIDPSEKALAVARRRLQRLPNVQFHHAGVDDIPVPDGSQDFGYSLGVLHHVPDTKAALERCVAKLKPGAPFLVYLYYSFDNRPAWFRRVWKASDLFRRGLSGLPFPVKKWASGAIAAGVYWPLTRIALAAEARGRNVSNYPLSYYREYSFYTMRTDALDRFGTRLEHRFSRDEIRSMMLACDLVDIRFSDETPFWVACGRKA